MPQSQFQSHRREYAELIMRRAEHLPPEDRALLGAVFQDGRTVKEVATLIGADARGLRRRLRGLVERVLSDRYIFVLSHRETWPALRRRLATACFIQGQTIKKAAEQSQTSFYNARKQIDAVHAILDSIIHAKSVSAEAPRRWEEGG